MNVRLHSPLTPASSLLDRNRVSIRVALVSAMYFAALGATYPLAAQQQNYDPQAVQDSQQIGQLVDPPSRVARLSVLQGNVSFQAAAAPDFAAAEINYPLTSGDRLYTDNGSRAELEAGQLTLRLGATADATVTSLTDDVAQFGLAQGSAHLRAYALDPDTTTEIDTPNASIGILTPGDYRVDVYPQNGGQPNVTVVTVLSGQVQVNADGVQQTLSSGQSFQVTGAGYNGAPAQAQLVRRRRPDELDQFSFQRDALYQQQLAQNAQNVNPGTIGCADLGQYGDWQQAPPPQPNAGDDGGYSDGPVWFPRGVAADWQPYSVGHWAYISPWGWTWVEAEPWGFAPFHYGRWARFGNRWGWIPGPPVIHPVYSPALVVFVGGGGFHLSIGGGAGVAAWFPLGPREVYRPPYRTNPGYINRINVTNIYTRNTVEVRNVYNNRSVNVYENGGPGREPGRGPGNAAGRPGFTRPDGGGGRDQYVNRNIATVAVPQDKFAGGRPVAGNALHVDPRQFAAAPVDNRPPVGAVRPGPNPAVPGSQPRALPPVQSRPAFANRGPAGAREPRAPDANGQNPNAQNPGTQNPGAQDPRFQAGFHPGGTAGESAPVAAPNQPRGGNDNSGFRNGGGRPVTPPASAPVTPNQPSPAPPARSGAQPADPGNNSHREGPRQTQPPPATAAPAPPTAPVNNNNYRRGPVQAPPPQQPPAAVAAPGAPAAPANNNNYRRGPVQAPPPQQPPAAVSAPAAPAAPANNNNYRRGPVQAPPPQQPPAAVAAPPAPTAPANNNNYRRGPVQAPPPPQPPAATQPPAQNESRRQGGFQDRNQQRNQPASTPPATAAPAPPAAPANNNNFRRGPVQAPPPQPPPAAAPPAPRQATAPPSAPAKPAPREERKPEDHKP